MLLSLRGPANQIDKFLAQVRNHRQQIIRSDMPAHMKRDEIEQLDAQVNSMLRDVIPKLKAQAEMPFFEKTFYSE